MYKVLKLEEQKHNNNGYYWYARELNDIFGYKNCKRMNYAIRKSILYCNRNHIDKDKHFKFIVRYKSKKRILDYELSSYACYLIIKYLDLKEDLSIYKEFFLCKNMSNFEK